MKNSLRCRIREFRQSKEGKVELKSPLTLGVGTGVLLVQAIIGTPESAACQHNNHYNNGQICVQSFVPDQTCV